MNQPQEPVEWRPVVGYEGRYLISSHGVIKSVARKVEFGRGFRWIKEKPIYQHIPSAHPEYLQVTLWIGNNGKSFKVHRLVLEAFHSPNPGGLQCRHLDGNSFNNKAANLAWGTAKENAKDRSDHGRVGAFVWGKRAYRPNSPLSLEDVREIRRSTKRVSELASEYSLSRDSIYNIRSGETWKHVPAN